MEWRRSRNGIVLSRLVQGLSEAFILFLLSRAVITIMPITVRPPIVIPKMPLAPISPSLKILYAANPARVMAPASAITKTSRGRNGFGLFFISPERGARSPSLRGKNYESGFSEADSGKRIQGHP